MERNIYQIGKETERGGKETERDLAEIRKVEKHIGTEKAGKIGENRGDGMIVTATVSKFEGSLQKLKKL